MQDADTTFDISNVICLKIKYIAFLIIEKFNNGKS